MSEILLMETVAIRSDKLGGSIPEILEEIVSRAEQSLRNNKEKIERTILEWAEETGHDLLAVADCLEGLFRTYAEIDLAELPRRVEDLFDSYVGHHTPAEYAYETYKHLVENLPATIKIDWDETYDSMPDEDLVWQGTNGHLFKI